MNNVSLTEEQIQKAVEFIIKQGNNPVIKKELEKSGYKLIPNSMNKLKEMLNNAGYDIVKINKNEIHNIGNETGIDTSKNNNETPKKEESSKIKTNASYSSESKNKPVLFEIFNQLPEKKLQTNNTNNLESISESNSVTDNQKEEINSEVSNEENLPWDTTTPNEKTKVDDSDLPWNTNSTKTIDNTMTKNTNEEFELIKNNWSKILLAIKQNSLALYSVVVKANLVDVIDNNVILGYYTSDTYQYKQFNIKENIIEFTKILNSELNSNYSIATTVIRE